jgi:hypothetical protein
MISKKSSLNIFTKSSTDFLSTPTMCFTLDSGSLPAAITEISYHDFFRVKNIRAESLFRLGTQVIGTQKYIKNIKMNKDAKIYIAGHNGMVGSAIWRTLTAKGYTNLIGASSKNWI